MVKIKNKNLKNLKNIKKPTIKDNTTTRFFFQYIILYYKKNFDT